MIRKLLSFLIIINLSACKPAKEHVFVFDGITFDASFPGARLNKVEKLSNSKYMAFIHPAFEPVNKSPWYAFSIHNKLEKEIEIVLHYGSYKHRYIPKTSTDKVSWKKIESSRLWVDTLTGQATLTIQTSPDILYVAAQEVISSQDTYHWMNNFLAKHPALEKKVAGKTVQNNNNYVLVLEKEKVNKSIVLVARQHPPEIPGGTIAFEHFFSELMAETDVARTFRNQFNIYTFPLLNPDGADAGNWRHNANGKDLNRDWIDFSQPETQAVNTFISNKVNAGKEIHFALDFHTSHSGPYLLVLDSINEAKTKGIIPKWIQGIENNSAFKVEARKRSQELPYCYNWFYNSFHAEAVTYEEGDETDRVLIAKRAKLYAQELMKTMTPLEVQ